MNFLVKNLRLLRSNRFLLNRSLTTSNTTQEQMDEVMKNPFFAKYKEKLQAAYK
jgi:hypothetical protein